MADPSPETFADLRFPYCGINLSVSFDQQDERPLPYNLKGMTTAEGVNVRAYEPATDRMRGASRPGISRYTPGTVAGPYFIQELNTIVDPTEAALLTAGDMGTVPNPAQPNGTGIGYVPPPPGGGYVPAGGDGFSLSRNVGGVNQSNAGNWGAGYQFLAGQFNAIGQTLSVPSATPNGSAVPADTLGCIAVIYNNGMTGTEYYIVAATWGPN